MQHDTTSADESEFESTDEQDAKATAKAFATRIARNGTGAMLVGGALVARAVKSSNRKRAVIQGLAGAGLLGLGVKQRRAGDGGDGDRRSLDLDEDEDEGGVQFTDEQDDEPLSKPGLDADVEDPRTSTAEDDEDVEIDVSDSALAAEPSEAAGPAPEQAQPTLTDDAEPETAPPGDASHTEMDVPGEEDDEAPHDDESEASDDSTLGEKWDDEGGFGDDEDASDDDEQEEEDEREYPA